MGADGRLIRACMFGASRGGCVRSFGPGRMPQNPACRMDTPRPETAVPKPRETIDLVMADGAVIRLRRHGNRDGPRLALSHGNGLAMDGYVPFWKPLLERYDIILFDMRNHGRNPLRGPAGHTWPNFARDMEAVWQGIRDHLGDRPVAGIFHSPAAVASLLHGFARGVRWSPLVLFDPPVYPRHDHPLAAAEAEHMREMAARARRRPERYPRPGLLATQLARRPEFRRWVPGAHELMARATLRRDPVAGDWVLCCPRELEARVFETNTDATVWPRLKEPPMPVKFVCGDPALPGQTPALIGQAMAAELPIAYSAVPGTTHFLQIEKPDVCIAEMEAFLKRHAMQA